MYLAVLHKFSHFASQGSCFVFIIFFNLKNLKIHLEELQRKRRREEGTFHPLVPSPDGCSSLGWVRLKPGAKNFVSVFLGFRSLKDWAISFGFPWCISRKLKQKWSSRDSAASVWDTGVTDSGLPSDTALTPECVLSRDRFKFHF